MKGWQVGWGGMFQHKMKSSTGVGLSVHYVSLEKGGSEEDNWLCLK